jgi:hypothetical protein
MRLLLAGILHLALLTTVAFGQATGDIESIGYEQQFRPGCWTPMVVRLTPTSGAPFKGKIAVYQEDADHDHVIFTRPVALRGNAEGGGEKTQRFWMYFIPQPDLLKDGNDPVALNRRLQVYLTDEKDKQIARLAVKDPIQEVDDAVRARSDKIVLCVVDQSKPIFGPYVLGRGALGLKETVYPVAVPIANVRNLLPESVLGYEAVDAVAWFDADPAQLSADQRSALEEYVRRGGKLVVCQTGRPSMWEMVKRGFGPLLPVDVQSIDNKTKDLTALKRITDARAKGIIDEKFGRQPQWKDVGKPPYEYAVAAPKPRAIVAETEEKDGAGRPWLVRGMFGSGTVAWVAQDLGDPNLTGRTGVAGTDASREDYKWMYLWDRVFDWGNASQPNGEIGDTGRSNFVVQGYRDRYADPGGAYQLARSFLGGMEFPGTGMAYLSLAVLFFIVYWVAAGPGSYLWLAARKRSRLSWFAFAALALIATGATVIIVKLVLRGSAQIHHVSFVRQTPGEPTYVHTQFGLYIPRDGMQRVELKNPAKDAASYVTAYPSLTSSDEGGPPLEYEVPVFDAKAVGFPYRSTLKKLQAHWVGEMPLGIEGGARISATNFTTLEGKLFNKSGRKLRNLYFVFRPRFIAPPDLQNRSEIMDQVLYIPQWDKDATIDLGTEFSRQPKSLSVGNTPEGGIPIKGWIPLPGDISLSWSSYWFSRLQNDSQFEDRGSVPSNFALLSLYDHLPAGSKVPSGHDRMDLHRAVLRDLDVSAAVGAGQLVVLAESDDPRGPLPIPIEVEGDVVAGEGTTYYQFILPLDRSALNAAPTTNKTGTATAATPQREEPR